MVTVVDIEDMEEVEKDGQPTLTRTDYLKLLGVCKRRNNRQFYLFVKLFGAVGLRPRELLDLTVETVRRGVIDVTHGDTQTIRLPKTVQKELLDYAASKRISSGLVFTSRDGRPLNYGWIRHSITALGLEAGIDAAISTPKNLRKMYLATQERIYDCLRKLGAQNYEWLLELEQFTAGWDM